MTATLIVAIWIVSWMLAIWLETDSWRTDFEVTRGHLLGAAMFLFPLAPLTLLSMILVWIMEGRLTHYLPFLSPDWTTEVIMERHKEER